MTDVHTFTDQGSRLTYQRFGTGPRALLAFHGMGQRSTCFAPLDRVLRDEFTIYSFDLFYHGDSSCLSGDEYTDGEVLTKARWQELIMTFLRQQGIDRFSVAGFSLGGRFALTTTELFAGRVDALWLFSPDGITISPWYWIAIHTQAGRWLFRYFLAHLANLHPRRAVADPSWSARPQPSALRRKYPVNARSAGACLPVVAGLPRDAGTAQALGGEYQ